MRSISASMELWKDLANLFPSVSIKSPQDRALLSKLAMSFLPLSFVVDRGRTHQPSGPYLLRGVLLTQLQQLASDESECMLYYH